MEATEQLLAVTSWHVENRRVIMEAGATIDTRTLQQVQKGKLCRMLMEADTAANVSSASQTTPLHLVATKGHVEACRVLMEAGETIDATNDKQFTPLYNAAKNGHAEICRMLMGAGAALDVRAGQQYTPLHAAAQKGHAKVCRMLTEAGAAVDARNEQQCSPLHLAAQQGNVEVCRTMMQAGAAVDARALKHATPLHIAAARGHVEACRVLLEAGAAVDARADQQLTPLHFAALFGNDSMCMLFNFSGADVTARSSANRTPADIAQFKGHAALAAHLRSSTGAHCLRCTGPCLQRRLLWNDTDHLQQEVILDEMQAQWLARVAEGCAHARVGLTLRGAFNGGLSTSMLLHVMGYVFGETRAHLQSCISTGRTMVARRGLATQMPVVSAPVVDDAVTAVMADGAVAAAEAAGAVSAVAKRTKACADRSKRNLIQRDQEQLAPKLALVSHALALAATPAPNPISSSSTGVMGAGARQQLQATLARLIAATEAAEGGCEWLHAYCNFLQRRHRLR
jgi:ankyrin repeat protein